MSTFPAYFRHRTYGPRCASPPTFVCYELPQPEPYSRSPTPSSDEYSDDDDRDDDSSTDSNSNSEPYSQETKTNDTAVEIAMNEKKAEDEANAEAATIAVDQVTIGDKPDAKASEPPTADVPVTENAEDSEEERRRIEKREGKKKEESVPVEKVEETVAVQVEKKRKDKKKSKRRHREESPAPPVRPILTIRSSQGFVWNQDLFVPPYIKERYIASSPPSSLSSIHGTPPKASFRNNNFFSTSNEMDYEVECVEIRVSEGEMDHLIPR